jgi:Lrp/AsnC family transcriptional regulator for asnA, asnC and gidA
MVAKFSGRAWPPAARFGGRMKIRSGKVPPGPGQDELDGKIVEFLRSNPRATNQEIAERLCVTAATVSSRLRRLEDGRAMRVVAVTDFSAHGYNVIAAVGVQVQGRKVSDVGLDLAALPEVLSVSVMNGAHDLELLVALRDFTEVNLFLTNHVAEIEGVSALALGIAADIMKFEFNVAPL